MPSLSKFQNRYRYFRYHRMLEHSKTSVMMDLLATSFYKDDVGDNKMFSFGFSLIDGRPAVGFGGVSGPFKVGVTTKALLRLMDRNPKTFVFHWDATYKIDSLAYPILVCGVSDAARKFHPVAFFLLGKETENEYTWAMASLMSIYRLVVGRDLQLAYVMADAAKAPALGVQAFYRQLGVERVLMCFYHLVANVHKRLVGTTLKTKALVFRHVYKMHYSRSWHELRHHWMNAVHAWTINDELVAREFTKYYFEQWIKSQSWRWQVYHSPSGFATTNNPCEAFNKHFKAVYSEKCTHGLCATFVLLGDVVEEYSTFQATEFKDTPAPSLKLLYRTRRLVEYTLLEVVPTELVFDLPFGEIFVRGVVPRHALSLAFAFALKLNRATVEDAATAIGDISMDASDYDVAGAYYYNKNTNNVRHESLCATTPQPWHGWRVRVLPGDLHCECNYFFKNSSCCHIIFALQVTNRDAQGHPNIPRTFERGGPQRAQPGILGRGRGRGRGRTGGRGSGRDHTQVGRALEFE
ncbi:Aste57867_1510 [Aphanomyces stellatus]|uniref:Aste57867_1510 protein n=1 Tax=Aphanomyces stellatus TaxID=120398 RepID=A0A485KAI0_9STRA|nr:hypothetical protein As57867_001509 [Aphanomyces stellatus]VFT78726.1 Aste57867_1510 [Aphanomyces stellatus]